jgi:predicted phage tail component-like protein
MTKENRMPDFTNNTITVPGREGLFDFGETIGERKIEISCFIPPGKSDEDFLARKDEIIAWLNPDIGLCDLILDKEPNRVYRARLESGFSFDKARAELLHLRPDVSLSRSVCLRGERRDVSRLPRAGDILA